VIGNNYLLERVFCDMLQLYIYSKTPLLRPPLDLRKNGLYSGVVLLLS